MVGIAPEYGWNSYPNASDSSTSPASSPKSTYPPSRAFPPTASESASEVANGDSNPHPASARPCADRVSYISSAFRGCTCCC